MELADDLRRYSLLDRPDTVERNHLPRAGARVHLLDVLGTRAELPVGLDVDAVGAVVELEIVHVRRPKERLHRVRDLAERQARGEGALPVDTDQPLRVVCGERPKDTPEPRPP